MSQRAVIGDLDGDFWVYDSETGFDLTRPNPLSAPRNTESVTLKATSGNITIDPARSALVIIDMQNFFLSPAIGRPAESKGLEAQRRVLEYAIPAARKAGIQVAWLNWGLSQSDLDNAPPALLRSFGFSTMPASEFNALYMSAASLNTEGNTAQTTLNTIDLGKEPRIYKGIGQQLGDITLQDGKVVPGGRMLMQSQWNTELFEPLSQSFKASLRSAKPDVWLNKSRVSGMHLPDTPAGLYFKNQGIRSLFFAGVNTDQCVNATMSDAYCQGYDCIMLRDGCATSSPTGSQECVERNTSLFMGFVVGCQEFSKGIDQSLTKREL